MTRMNLLARMGMGLLALAATPHALGTKPCPPDIDCSGMVNVSDLLSVIGAWGPGGGGSPSDVNNSGGVDVADLLAVIGAWGPCQFNFGPSFANAEAHQIGLEMLGAGGALTLSPAQYDRIVRDLDLIRAAFPALASQTHSPAWVANQFIIGLESGVPQTELPCLNTYYQASSAPLGSLQVITTAGKVNVPALCVVYDAAPEVSFAEPDGFFGGENFWTPTDLGGGAWRWNIDDGFLDCFDGCDCHKLYVIDVSGAGAVNLVSYQEVGQPWCKFN